jgi:AraC-like DNA-binding protein/quercetin dioxygenase-like cupin family protein
VLFDEDKGTEGTMPIGNKGDDQPLPGDVQDAGVTLIGLAVDYPAGTRIPRHRHLRHQFLYAVDGVMSVRVTEGEWIVPPLRAVWIPAPTEHTVTAKGRLAMRTLYFHPDCGESIPTACRVVDVAPLLRELVLRAVEMGQLRRDDRGDARLLAMIIDEIRALPETPLHLPEPRDARLRRVTEALRAQPADDRPLAAWARVAGASPRTLARLFRQETGMSFGQWRRQARLATALEGLAAGKSVKSVAIDAGYASSSAFVAMFRRALGTTPARYFSA